jgi:transcriptional regulator with XRE-family HTH domain
MRDKVAERFGRNLRMARRRAGCSQEELAERCGLTRGAIGRLENGHCLARADTLVRLLGGLGVSADELLRGIEWTPPAPVKGTYVTRP